MRFDQIGVTGASPLAGELALKFAAEGLAVTLVVPREAGAAPGRELVQSTLQAARERGHLARERKGEIPGRISSSEHLEDLAEADLVLVLPEERDGAPLDEIFPALDGICKPHTILALCAPSSLVKDAAAATARADRVIGLHHLPDPLGDDLVEVIATSKTSAPTFRSAWALQERLGLIPIEAADVPGFAIQRLLLPWCNEAARLLEEGNATAATIECAARQRFAARIGPFERMNRLGPGWTLRAVNALALEMGAFHSPSAELVAHGEGDLPWNFQGEPDARRLESAGERLAAVAFLAAAQIGRAEIATVEDLDLGARVAMGWRHGPFAMMNAAGIAHAQALVEDLAERHDDLVTPELLAEQRRRGTPFEVGLVRLSHADGIATIAMRRPDAHNAIDAQLMRQLALAFGEAATDPEVQAIVLTGTGPVFSRGADLDFFARALEEDDFKRIFTWARRGQDLLSSFAQCSKPVIARLEGPARGAGAELALACDWILATAGARLEFPEVGLGFHPLLGGTQRTTRRVGVGLTRFLVLGGAPLGAEAARSLGLIDEIVPCEDLPAAIQRHAERPKPGPRTPPSRVPREWKAIAEYFGGQDIEALLEGSAPPPPDHPLLGAALEHLRTAPPQAVRVAAALIAEGRDLSIRDALALELADLRAIFRSREVYDALTRAASGCDPQGSVPPEQRGSEQRGS